jgi:SAM-dependent methyltransferase
VRAMRLARSVWTALPGPVRSAISRSGVLHRVAAFLPHDAIYTDGYYAFVDETTKASAGAMATSIIRDLRPASVLDVGCGTGALLDALRARGATVRGLEYSSAALEYCRRRELDVERYDIEREAPRTVGRFDVASSMEVAEHLPARVAEQFVDLLAASSDRVVLTAATPGQGGTDHVNEQPHEYWIEKFRRRGFTLNEALSARWREEWTAARVASWFSDNVMVFERPR